MHLVREMHFSQGDVIKQSEVIQNEFKVCLMRYCTTTLVAALTEK